MIVRGFFFCLNDQASVQIGAVSQILIYPMHGKFAVGR